MVLWFRRRVHTNISLNNTYFQQQCNLRSTSSINLNPKVRTAPKKIIRRPTVPYFLEAFKIYKSNPSNSGWIPIRTRVTENDDVFPSHLTGYRIGLAAEYVRTLYHKEKLDKIYQTQLSDAGFYWTYEDYKFWNDILPALQCYYKLHGHINVPQSYVIDDAVNFPPKFQRMALGRRVESIRAAARGPAFDPKRRDAIDTLSNNTFSWHYSLREIGERFTPLYKIYKSVYDSPEVPLMFVIPPRDPWPKNMYGYNFGLKVNFVQKSQASLSEDVVEGLNALEFPWDSCSSTYTLHHRTFVAIKAYYKEFNALDIPAFFTFSSTSSKYPPRIRGWKFGSVYKKLRTSSSKLLTKKLEVTYGRELDEMGYFEYKEFESSLTSSKNHDNDSTTSSLSKDIIEFLSNPVAKRKFWNALSQIEYNPKFVNLVVNEYKVGLDFSKFRKGYHANFDGITSEDIENLIECGKLFAPRVDAVRFGIIPGIKAFKKEFGHVNIPTNFVIPWEDSPLKGYKLGFAITKLRFLKGGESSTSASSTYRLSKSSEEELNDLGFVWSIVDQHWKERTLPALEAWMRIHSTEKIPSHFIVPTNENDGWPVVTRGYSLGKTFQHMTNFGRYRTQIQRDTDYLREIGYFEITKKE